METVIFFILAGVAVAAGVGVIAQRNAFHSALLLLVNFCCLAGLYLLQNAQFVALAQIIVYAGAVVVLFLFAVMLLGAEGAEEKADPRRYLGVLGGLLGLLFLIGVVWALLPAAPETVAALSRSDNVRQIGAALLTDLALPFEMASVLLLAAIIGAVVLAKRKVEG